MADIDEKWGSAVAGRGFAQIPNYLLLINQFLDEEHRLAPGELLVLFQLVGAWWKKDELPFPSIETLSLRCGISKRQVQRSLARLEELNLIRRVQRRTRGIIASNAYDILPLVEVLGEIAKVFPNEFPRRLSSTQSERLRAVLDRGPILLPDRSTAEGGGATPKRLRKIKPKPLPKP